MKRSISFTAVICMISMLLNAGFAMNKVHDDQKCVLAHIDIQKTDAFMIVTPSERNTVFQSFRCLGREALYLYYKAAKQTEWTEAKEAALVEDFRRFEPMAVLTREAASPDLISFLFAMYQRRGG